MEFQKILSNRSSQLGTFLKLRRGQPMSVWLYVAQEYSSKIQAYTYTISADYAYSVFRVPKFGIQKLSSGANNKRHKPDFPYKMPQGVRVWLKVKVLSRPCTFGSKQSSIRIFK